MRFLRRGGKDRLPIEVESTAAEVDGETPETREALPRPAWLEVDGAAAEAEANAAGADEPHEPAGPAGLAAEPAAAEVDATLANDDSGDSAADPEPAAVSSADAELHDAVAESVGRAAAEAGVADAEPDAADAPNDARAEAAAEPEHAGPADATAESAAELEHAGPADARPEPAAEPTPKPTTRSRRKRAAAIAAEPEAKVRAPEVRPSGGDEDLAALVAGGGNAVEPDVEAAPTPAPAHPFAPNLVIDDSVWPDPLADGRPAALRLAGLHLRTGQHALARAELESLAGRGRLDEPALLDLAEVRWRTGDLAGAGDAANALLARGTEAPLAIVIAAEAVASAGRPSEARRLSARALEVVDGPLDPVFAGMPRALIWPVAAITEPSPTAPRRRGRRAKREQDGAPSTASEAFAGGRAALAKGDASRAALLLGVAMRLEPGFAEDVLRAVAGRDDQPLLALVRGDALRLLGREAEALEAFDRARGRSSASATASSAPAGPGLFDDDPG